MKNYLLILFVMLVSVSAYSSYTKSPTTGEYRGLMAFYWETTTLPVSKNIKGVWRNSVTAKEPVYNDSFDQAVGIFDPNTIDLGEIILSSKGGSLTALGYLTVNKKANVEIVNGTIKFSVALKNFKQTKTQLITNECKLLKQKEMICKIHAFDFVQELETYVYAKFDKQ